VAPALTKSREQTGGAEGVSCLDGVVDIARDRDLVERCQAGDRTAFDELYRRYHRRLFHFCLRRLHRSQEAEDAVQEAFTRAWRAMPGFAGERRFYPWLTVIGGNICTDALRRGSRETPVEDLPMPLVDATGGDVDERVLREENAAMVITALERLSERHQRVLRLREWSGWSIQRIAEHEGVAVPAAETLLWRARQALKREYSALADTGSRLGAALGLGALAARRFLNRAALRVSSWTPILQAATLDRPRAVALSAIIALGIAGGAVLMTSSPPARTATVATPAPAGHTVPAAPSSLVGGAPSYGERTRGATTAAPVSSGAGAAGASSLPEGGATTPGPAPAPASAGGGVVLPADASPSVGGGAAGPGTTITKVAGGVDSTITKVAGGVDSTITKVAGGAGTTITKVAGGAGTTITKVAGGADSTITKVAGGAGSTATTLGGILSPLGGGTKTQSP